ncbi:uncharacterized protein LOC130985719 isoform X3 [Salvia miltiorrhiza]|uniref:uncharacterized protein LOC130985719 isoform X3 n=1 Tax=Salvia miltiorrhiza TaxID=226208 RepID=UPI0025ACEB07|nr:uncharacterized protein LOC130985719 isoform X3 [Salvia miltiorrhiza]
MLPEADAVDRCTFRPMTKPLLPFPAAKPDKASTSAPHAVAPTFLPLLSQGLGRLQLFDEFEIGGDGCSSERSKNSENEFKTLPNGLKYYDLKTRDGLEAVKGSRVIV